MPLDASKTLLAVMVAAIATAPAAFGDKKNATQRAVRVEPARTNVAVIADSKAKSASKGARTAPNPITPIDRWNAMNPQQRERMLERMDPDRRKQFLEKLDRFNALPKEEQQLTRERYQRLSQLSPEQQQVVRRDMKRLDKLPPERREAMFQEFVKLRSMSASDRSAYLASPEFRDRFRPAEQQMIGNLTTLLPAGK
jgi:hypothetical protein